MSDPDKGLRERLPAGGAVAVQTGPEPRDVVVVVPAARQDRPPVLAVVEIAIDPARATGWARRTGAGSGSERRSGSITIERLSR